MDPTRSRSTTLGSLCDGSHQNNNASVNEIVPFVEEGERIDYFALFLPFRYIFAVNLKCRLCYVQGHGS
jgi:hypothetical protein